jgi:Putative peptidoglycan binding domain
MHTLALALLVSLLGVGPMLTAAGQPRGQGEPPAAPAPALTADQIKRAQEALKREGLYPGPLDGKVGPQTRQALRAYQAREGLPPTGVLDEATFRRLVPAASNPEIDWNIVVELITGLAWPIVVAIALYWFRRPLRELLFQVARRAQKLSVFQVSVQLAPLPELHTSWSVASIDLRQLNPYHLIDNPSIPLFAELLKPVQADYAIVSLAAGNEWVTSRLFIVAVVLGVVRGLRAFVFLETAGGIRRRFIGVATPENVRSRLGIRYPWLEEACIRTFAGQYMPRDGSESAGAPTFLSVQPRRVTYGSTASEVQEFVRQFVMHLQLQSPTAPPQNEEASYLLIPAAGTGQPMWERAHWIDGERLERDLADVLENDWYEDSPDTRRNLAEEAILKRKGTFVALVNRDRQFLGLVDRYALLDQISKREEAGSRNAEPTAR